MTEIFVLCRLLHYGATMLLFGAGAFSWGLAPRRLGAALNDGMWRIAGLAALLLVVTTPGWLLAESGLMGEGWPDVFNPRTIETVLLDTEFGRVWQWHGVLVVALLAAIVAGRSAATWTLSALVLADLGLVGHAATQSGLAGWSHRINLAVHLLGGGFWLGGLVPLLATLRIAGKSPLRDEAIVALRRFSAIGHAAVAVVLLTGGVNAVLILGMGSFDPSSAYQVLLSAKVILVALMVGLALINRYRIVPHFHDRPDASRALIRNSALELALGVCVLAIVSLFGLLEPR